MNKKVLVILAEGFEEVEVVTPIDMLRRAQIDVTICGLNSDTIKSTRALAIKTDMIFSDYNEVPDVIVLPGGMPGAEHLAASTKLKDLLIKMNDEGKLIAAICASPALVLENAGILNGRTATCYPGMEGNFSSRVKFSEEKIIQDGNIITSKGAGTAHLFALKITENIVGADKAKMIFDQMLFEL